MSESASLSPSSHSLENRDTRPTFAICTLGCKVNQYDSLRMARLMEARGFRQVPFPQRADAYIIDTCTVTHVADRKSRKAVSRAVRENPEAVIAVTGCAAEWQAERFRRLSDHAIVVGNRGKGDLPARVEEALRRRNAFDFAAGREQVLDGPYAVPVATRTRAVLKVQDGCHRQCAFCIIPRVRGRPYSRPLAEVVAEARQMVEAGAHEIVLTGVILGWYGQDLRLATNGTRQPGLPTLLRALETIDGLRRVRLSAVDPRDLSHELVETMAACEKVCPYLHLVLQSGSDAVLRSMRRGYTTAKYASWVDRLRQAMPDLGLHTDVIVGFPGETESHFAETLAFVRRMRFSGMHIFPYSARPGTPAADWPDPLDPVTISSRGKTLARLAQELKAEYAARYLGRRTSILVEQTRADGTIEGLTDTYVRVRAQRRVGPAGPGERTAVQPLTPGELVTVRAVQWQDDHLVGTV